VDVTVEHERRLELFDESVEGGKPTVGRITFVAAIQWR
jgi:hypothetical protein